MYEEATLKKTTFWSFIRRIYLPKYFQSQEILEQHYPMDFLRWWKYSLFALSKMVATPTYGYLIRSKYKLGSRKSRDTWSKRQIWPQSTKWSRSKANRLLPREHTGCSKHPLPTTQEKALHMDITRWSIPKSDWLYSLQPKIEKFYTVSKNKTGSWLWHRPWNPYCQIQT